MCPSESTRQSARRDTDYAVAELVRMLKIVLDEDELSDDEVIRGLQSRLNDNATPHPIAKVLVRRISGIAMRRRVDESDRSALRILCSDLAKNRRFRSAAVALSRILVEERRRQAEVGKYAYEQEIIRLIESGAVVNCGPVKAKVITTVYRGRAVKKLAGEAVENMIESHPTCLNASAAE